MCEATSGENAEVHHYVRIKNLECTQNAMVKTTDLRANPRVSPPKVMVSLLILAGSDIVHQCNAGPLEMLAGNGGIGLPISRHWEISC